MKPSGSRRSGEGSHPAPWLAPVLGSLAVPAAASFLLYAFFGEGKWVQEPFHSTLETAGGAVAVVVAVFLVLRRAYPGQSTHYEWVVPALLCMGALDLAHAMIPVSPAFFWSRALPTFLGGILMALVWIPVERIPPAVRGRLAFLGLAVGLPLSALLIAFPQDWPRLFDARGAYTAAAKLINIAGGLGFLAAAAWFLRSFRRTGSREDYVFANHCLLFGAASLLFSLSHMWGTVWWFFHFLRFGAYAVVLGYVVRVVRDLASRERERFRSDLGRAQREILDRTERLDLAMDSAQLGSWDLDVASGRILWSPQHERLFGYEPGQPERTYEDWKSRLHPEDSAGAETAVREALARGGDFRVGYRIVLPGGGETRWMSARGRVLTDGNGKPVRMLGVVWDVTEAKRAEEEARKARDQLEAILQNIYDAVVVEDAEGRYLYANEAAARLLGLPSADAVLEAPPEFGRTAIEIADEFGSPIPYAELPGPQARRGIHVAPKPMRLRIVATGEERWALVGARPVLDAQGKVLYAVIFAHDVTERRRIEESLRESQEMLRQSQKLEAVGRLAGGVAHDFNNLLTAINGFSDIALASAPEDEPLRPHLEEIRKAGERAAGLTRQLLAFGRKQMLAPRRMNLNPLVEGMLELLRRLIGEHIRVETDLDPRLADARVDPGQMEQVILNLAINARDAMPNGGTLSIRTWNEDRGAAGASGGAGPRVALAVADTGHGMDESVRERIFEPFFTTKGFGKGSGLGLATVHGIVSQSGGDIAVDSEPNRGAVFVIRLPAEAGAAAEPKPERPRDAAKGRAGGGGTLLVAEDEAAVRRLASGLLRAKGYRVLEAADGMEAMRLQQSYEGPIDLLLTDVIMPNMNGRELAERLAETRGGVPVLFMSGYADAGTLGEIEPAPDRGFLAKPFSPADLLGAVERLLHKPQDAAVGPRP